MTEAGYAPTVTANPIQILIINPDDTYELRTVNQDIKIFQGIVGGWVEAIPTEHCTFWADEDGKDKKCPTNTLATYLWWNMHPEMEGHDVLNGAIFVTGLADSEGRTLPVPDSVIEYFERIRAIYMEHKDEE